MPTNPWQPPDHDHQNNRNNQNDYSEYTGYDNGRHRRPPSFVRLFLFFTVIIILVFLLWNLSPLEGDDTGYLLRGLILLIVVGGSAAYWSQSSTRRFLKVAGLWYVIISVISGVYLFRTDFSSRVMTAVDPSGIAETDDGLIVRRSRDGHFWLRAEINDVPVRMMVDTGASNVVLTPNDAGRIGIDVDSLEFSKFADTANGRVSYARVEVGRLALGPTRFRNVPITVNGADMHGSLLGLSVLNEFSSVEFKGDLLILRP